MSQKETNKWKILGDTGDLQYQPAAEETGGRDWRKRPAEETGGKDGGGRDWREGAQVSRPAQAEKSAGVASKEGQKTSHQGNRARPGKCSEHQLIDGPRTLIDGPRTRTEDCVCPATEYSNLSLSVKTQKTRLSKRHFPLFSRRPNLTTKNTKIWRW